SKPWGGDGAGLFNLSLVRSAPHLGQPRLARFLLFGKPLADVSPDIETQVLHRGIVAKSVDTAAHAKLHPLADRPILPGDQVPELNGIFRIEARLRHLAGMKQKVAIDARALRRQRP